ncbi:Guanylyl cyclase [Phycomyces blakesleeanus]|uniref:Guanylyl cyclase n=1 Tax=Phycomyces blakesleeanus TaxID=4837 RepID=A0ABR3AVC5_PHYBL
MGLRGKSVAVVESGSDQPKNYEHFANHRVAHIIQNSNWDCGIACIAMVLQGLGIRCSLRSLAEQCAVESVWTIDLAVLLRNNYEGDFTYYTSYFGSRREHQENKFYQDDFDEDERRVNKLFGSAKSKSIHVVRMMLPMDDFKRFLYCQRFVIVVLVNARLLKCQKCREQRNCVVTVCGQFDFFFEKMKGYDYIGHFICLIGYDPTENLFIYRDPAVVYSYCTISAEDLDNARKASGTDHDCIVIQI